jgi:hypothetical protein
MGDLIVTIFYDSDDGESQISLVFKHSCFQRITNDYAGLSVFSIHILPSKQLLHFVYIFLQALYKAEHKDL